MGDGIDFNQMAGSVAKGAAEGLGKNIPTVYTDLVKPSAIELGKGLAAAIKIALTPISVAIWGYDKIAEWLTPELENRLGNIQIENIIPPNPAIAGPAIEAMRFMGDEEELRALFAQLIASSMDSKSASKVHHGFVEIIKNLSSEDALVLKWFSEYALMQVIRPKSSYQGLIKAITPLEIMLKRQLISNGLDSILNLTRLGLLDIQNHSIPYPKRKKIYPEDINVSLDALKLEIPIEIQSKSLYWISSLGERFCEMCL